MTNSFPDKIRNYAGQPLTRQLLLDLLRDYNRPFDKIADLVSQKLLTSVKRGVFVPGPALHMTQPEPFLLANHLTGPSYVSREAALSYWRLIPEKVFEITSMTTGRSKIYDTPVGRFSYQHLPLPYYSFGQQQTELAKNQVVLIATSEKAICDTVIATSGLRFRSESQVKNWLLEDMRMDPGILRTLNITLILEWVEVAPKQDSLQLLVETIQKL
jgi:hypothetical protein